MEYVFGEKGKGECLKTKGEAHTDLVGWQEITREYPDQVITDKFRIVRKTAQAEDDEGYCYDWYEIDRHYRTCDKTGPVAERVSVSEANIDYISMMAGIELPEEG